MSKHYEWTPLCRIYWTSMPETELCIQEVTEVVNSMYQNAVPYLVDPCATTNGIGGIVAGPTLEVSPNPVRSGEGLTLSFAGGELQGAEIRWVDLTGRVVAPDRWTGGRQMTLSTEGRAPGAYLVQVIQRAWGATIEHTRRVTVR